MEQQTFIQLQQHGKPIPAEYLDTQRIKPSEISEIFRRRGLPGSGLYPGQVYLSYLPAVFLADFESPGTLVITNFRLAFISSQHMVRLSVPMGLLQKFERKEKKEIVVQHRLNRKALRFRTDREDQAEECCRFAGLYLEVSFVRRDDFMFAYAKHSPPQKEQPVVMPIDKDVFFLEVQNNVICYEYPYKVSLPHLESSFLSKLIPDFVSQTFEIDFFKKKLQDLALLRNNKRFPVVVHARVEGPACMVRCSHYRKPCPLSKLKDEPTTAAVVRISKKIGIRPIYLHIIEEAKKITQLYRNVDLKILQFPPLSQLKKAFLKQQEAYQARIPKDYFELLDGSGWLAQAVQLIKISTFITWEYKNKSKSVIIDCPDGVDKSATVSALVQVMIDNKNRTTRGLGELVQREFVEMGHPFHNRHNSTSEQAPTFLQFLECLHQLVQIYPLHFEYNSCFLAELGLSSYSRMHRNFMFNCVREAHKNGGEDMRSVWELGGSEEFVNPFYCPQLNETLTPDVSLKNVRFFAQLHAKFSVGGTIEPRTNERQLEEAHRQTRAALQDCKQVQTS